MAGHGSRLAAHKVRGPGWPGPPDCRGRIRGRQRAEGMNQRVPGRAGQATGARRHEPGSQPGAVIGGDTGGSGGGTQHTPGHTRTGITDPCGGCHRPRQHELSSLLSPVTRGRAPWPSLATHHPASPGLARQPRSVRG